MRESRFLFRLHRHLNCGNFIANYWRNASVDTTSRDLKTFEQFETVSLCFFWRSVSVQQHRHAPIYAMRVTARLLRGVDPATGMAWLDRPTFLVTVHGVSINRTVQCLGGCVAQPTPSLSG